MIDSDRILVLGNGELLEFDAPSVLLSNPNSHFTSLVEQTGAAEAEHLRTLAKKVKHPTFNSDDELLEKDNENDPLISSHEKIQ